MNDITPKLLTILQMVNEWLRFGEAKNGILFGFSGAGITATITYLSAAPKNSMSIQIGVLITTFLLCVCALVCALSFLPRTNLEYLVWRKSEPRRKLKSKQDDNGNFYYFGHLLNYQADELLEALNRLYFEGNVKNIKQKEYLDIANQIVINSEIAYLKYRLFLVALYLLILAISSIPICLIFSLIIYHAV